MGKLSTVPPNVESTILQEPLWKVRLKLFRKQFAKNWDLFTEKKIGLLGIGIIIFFILFAIAHPILMVYWSKTPLPADAMMGPNKTYANIYHPIRGLDLRPQEDMMPLSHPSPPSAKHLLGTDSLGRDLLSQLMYCTRMEFFFGVLSALIGVMISTLLGTISAYFGGKIDTFVMRLADLVMTFPRLPFLIFLSSLMTMDLVKLAVVLGILSGFGGSSIVLKSQALSVTVRPYIEAAKVAGGGHWHVIFRHIIPNVLPLSFLYLMMGVTGAIMSEATLSFLGLLQAPISWGLTIQFARQFGYSFYQAWWLYLPAGITITLFCGAFYAVGRGLDTIVNPKLRKR